MKTYQEVQEVLVQRVKNRLDRLSKKEKTEMIQSLIKNNNQFIILSDADNYINSYRYYYNLHRDKQLSELDVIYLHMTPEEKAFDKIVKYIFDNNLEIRAINIDDDSAYISIDSKYKIIIWFNNKGYSSFYDFNTSSSFNISDVDNYYHFANKVIKYIRENVVDKKEDPRLVYVNKIKDKLDELNITYEFTEMESMLKFNSLSCFIDENIWIVLGNERCWFTDIYHCNAEEIIDFTDYVIKYLDDNFSIENKVKLAFDRIKKYLDDLGVSYEETKANQDDSRYRLSNISICDYNNIWIAYSIKYNRLWITRKINYNLNEIDKFEQEVYEYIDKQIKPKLSVQEKMYLKIKAVLKENDVEFKDNSTNSFFNILVGNRFISIAKQYNIFRLILDNGFTSSYELSEKSEDVKNIYHFTNKALRIIIDEHNKIKLPDKIREIAATLNTTAPKPILPSTSLISRIPYSKIRKTDDRVMAMILPLLHSFPSNIQPEVNTISPIPNIDKTKYSLVPIEAITILAEQLTKGLEKYPDPNNWKKLDSDKFYNSMMRHLASHKSGDLMNDNGFSNIDAMFMNAMFLWWHETQGKDGTIS